MTAIAAILAFHGEHPPAGGIDRLLFEMRKRSPDGQRQWAQNSVALGEGLLDTRARPLATLPAPEHGLASLDALHLVWDGRIDNRDELERELVAAGDLSAAQAKDLPDRDLILYLYRRHGNALPPRLLGDFAFAIWNADSQTLFCARDCMGARPFYCTLQPGFFALASEDEAMLPLPGVDPSPNLDRVAYALCPGFNAFDWQKSWLEQVFILMPGTALTISAGRRLRRWTWWHWARPEIRHFKSDEEALEAFGDVMRTATRDRTRDLDTVGIIASGGMDTAVVAVAASQVRQGRPLRFFSTVDDDPSHCIETRGIESLAATLGADLHRLHVPSMRGMCSADDLAEFYRRPHPVDDSIALVAMMCLGASRTGQRVLLHGATGDLALYANDDYLLRFAAECGWAAAFKEVRAAQRSHTYVQGSSLLRLWTRAAYQEWAPPALKQVWRDWRRCLRGKETNWLLEAGDFGVSQNIARRMREASLRSERACWTQPRTVSEQLDALFPMGVVRGLEGYERVAGRYGVALRDPLSDRRVIEFCLSLPLHLRVRDGWTKSIARRWTGAVLPDECVWRSDKMHLGHYLSPPARGQRLVAAVDRPNTWSPSATQAITKWQLNADRVGFDQADTATALLQWVENIPPADVGKKCTETNRGNRDVRRLDTSKRSQEQG